MEKIMWWEGRHLVVEPKVDDDGFFVVRSKHYAPLAACARRLGVSYRRLRRVLVETLPPEGMVYGTTPPSRRAQTYHWRRTTYWPVERLKRLVDAERRR